MIVPILTSLFYPLIFSKRQLYSLDRLKREICFHLNKIHNEDIFKPSDYKLKINLFGGYCIQHKKTNIIIASSDKMNNKYVELELNNINLMTIPDIEPFDSSHFNNDFKLNETMSVIHRRGYISKTEHIITIDPLVVHEVNRCCGETIYTDIKLIRDKNHSFISTNVRNYTFGCMYGYTVDSTDYGPSYNVQELFLAYALEHLKENQYAIEVFPELVTHTTTNYNSDEFKQRLELFDILSI